MDQGVKRVVIAGGGTAGWMCAAALSRLLNRAGVTVTVVESDEISTIGVGEATIPSIGAFNSMLGIDESDFVRETQGTFKLGIEFIDWDLIGASYIHPFGTAGLDWNGIAYHQYWLKVVLAEGLGRVGSFEHHNLTAMAARHGRFMKRTNDGSIFSTLRHAYHFDATLYAKFLRTYSEARGVTRVEGHISAVNLTADEGCIASLRVDGDRTIEGDLFIDCTGFRAILLGRALGITYRDWSHYLPCDRALAVQSGPMDVPLPYTRATADTAGWRWQIPLQHRTGNGYVYCSRFLDEGAAEERLLASLCGQAITSPRLIRFTTGRREIFWEKNCVAIGLASGFLEPLESTSIHLIQSAIARLVTLFPNRAFSAAETAQYNRQTAHEVDQIRDFIVMHYKVSRRNDTAFWRHCRDMAIPESLQHKIEVFRVRGRIAREPDDLFTADSWLAVMLGQGLMPDDYDPVVDTVDKREIDRFVHHVRDMVEQNALSLPAHDAFLAKCCQAPVQSLTTLT